MQTCLVVCTFSPALSVVIDISYTPPEEGYQPPYYRAASHATLTCRAVGTTSKIRFLWTSTCSGCSVPGGYYYSYSGSTRNLILRSRNAGTHHCFAYDSVQGISGTASTVMNIVGEHSGRQYIVRFRSGHMHTVSAAQSQELCIVSTWVIIVVQQFWYPILPTPSLPILH